MRKGVLPFLGVLLTVLLLPGCDSESNPLAEYEAERPLILQRVTQSFTPEIQWLGGRVAAVGVNRGEEAALDSTLVWLKISDGDDISSHAVVGQETDTQTIIQFDGTPLESLEDGQTYTFWLATKQAWDANLNPGSLDEHAFADTTMTIATILNGNQRGSLDVQITVIRDERLTGTRYFVHWTPADKAFRRIAIRRGFATAGFTDLVWHVVLPDDEPDSITSPVVIGEVPEGAIEAIAWPETGFTQDVHFLWMVDETWDGTFGLRAPGMAAFQLFADNF